METNAIVWAVVVVCLAVSFVLSGMEAGVFALSRLRIRQQMTGQKIPAWEEYGQRGKLPAQFTRSL